MKGDAENSNTIDTVGDKEIALISSTINDISDDDGWAFLGDVGSSIQKRQPSFDSRNRQGSSRSNKETTLDQDIN